ncbi:MAG: esterase-like activity of phytase family protein [Hormoscilla sp.]
MKIRKGKILPWLLAIMIGLSSLLTSCELPQVTAEERIFLGISLEFLGSYELPKTTFADTPVGGISAIAYDRRLGRIYALSDDRSEGSPARFYTMRLDTEKPNIEIEKVTYLIGPDGNYYPWGAIDPEGITITPDKTIFISTEGIAGTDIGPAVEEFDIQTGRWQRSLPIPKHYIPDGVGDKQQLGVQENRGFEALTINPSGTIPSVGEPLRLFVATESALAQDRDPDAVDMVNAKSRWLHYLVGYGRPQLLSEHFYLLDPPPPGALFHGLAEILAVDRGGHFLSLERSFGFLGFSAKIFQLATGAASDISNVTSLKGDLTGLNPIRKQLLLDLNSLGITLDNLEGMTLGPRLPDGSKSLILVSDDNFRDDQVTQVLLFSLQGLKN